MGQLLLPLAVGTMATGQVMSAVAAKRQADNEAAISEYNQNVAKQDARRVEARSILEQRRHAQASDRIMGSLEAELGASGAVTTVGAPLLAKAKQFTELELDRAMIGYEGQISAARARSQAALYGMEGTAAKQRGKNLLTTGLIGAGSTVLGGFYEMRGTPTEFDKLVKKSNSWLDTA